jgi:hypothetical protein
LAKKSGNFRKVSAVIALFVGMGCELRATNCKIQLNGEEIANVRYLIAPDGKNFVPIEDVNDDEFISEDEINYWETRLGISIPPANQIN